jgi:hypothetical protein
MMRRLLMAAAVVLTALTVTGVAAPRPAFAWAPPNPQLTLTAIEAYTAQGKEFIRYRFDVTNKDAYPAEMFAASPNLPPCGANPNASRSWVDFFDSSGRRLYGFCALKASADLGSIWFAVPRHSAPPPMVYIEINDRRLHAVYRSNLAATAF